MCVDSLTTLQNFIENFIGFKNDDTITYFVFGILHTAIYSSSYDQTANAGYGINI